MKAVLNLGILKNQSQEQSWNPCFNHLKDEVTTMRLRSSCHIRLLQAEIFQTFFQNFVVMKGIFWKNLKIDFPGNSKVMVLNLTLTMTSIVTWPFFKKKIWRTWVLFVGPLIPLFLDFWWCLLWVSKPKWASLSALGGGIHFTHSLRFTSGVTPADLLAASMTAEPISSTYLWPGIGGAWMGDLSRQRLYRLSYAGSAFSGSLGHLYGMTTHY